MNEEEEDEDKSVEESRAIKGKKNVVTPSREEYEEHMRTHIPFRKWCLFCAQGKMAANPKRSASEGEDSEVPIIGWDYMEQKTKEGQYREVTKTPKRL